MLVAGAVEAEEATDDAADEFTDLDFFGLAFSVDLCDLVFSLPLVLVSLPSEDFDLDARFVGDLLIGLDCCC